MTAVPVSNHSEMNKRILNYVCANWVFIRVRVFLGVNMVEHDVFVTVISQNFICEIDMLHSPVTSEIL